MRKVALVTGSSQGVGKAIAKALLDGGYCVYLNGRDEERIRCVLEEFNTPLAKAIVQDLSVHHHNDEALNLIIDNESHIDLIVCNIGSGKSSVGLKPDMQEYQRVFEINYFSAVSLALLGVEKMKDRGGHIVVIGSIAGCEALGAPLPYSNAKTALLGFAKGLSQQVASWGIRVNAVSPGNVMFKGSTWDDKTKGDPYAVERYIQDNVPLNRFATPEDIAQAVLFLEQATFVTGSNLIVDGGQVNKIL